MDWRVLFNRLKFVKHILLFLGIMAGVGLVAVIGGQSTVTSAILIFLLAVVLSYIKSMGLIVLWIERKQNINSFITVDGIINLIIIMLFGYRYIIILSPLFWSYASYAVLWGIYIWVVYIRVIRNTKYFIYYRRNKK